MSTRLGFTTILAGFLAAGALGRGAQAQSVSGNAFVSANCGGNTTQPLAVEDDFTISVHGFCDSPREGGIGSVNDGVTAVRLLRGLWGADCSAVSDFRGTHDAAGTAGASTDPFYTIGDLVFTDTNNPGSHAIVQASMNFRYRARVETQGASNCSPFNPTARVAIGVFAPGGQISGHRYESPGVVDVAGLLDGYPNDGSEAAGQTASGGVDLGARQSLQISTSCGAGVSYCDFPPAEVGTARAMAEVSLPVNGPVFNLPPGITVNSPSLHIVNNRWLGASACGGADFNGDGDIGTDADIEAFFACLSGDCCATCDPRAADFNGDGDIGTDADIESFFRVLGGGPC